MPLKHLLQDAQARAVSYLRGLKDRPVFPVSATRARLAELDFNLPLLGMAAEDVLALLDEVGSPNTVASAGGRYYGFVTGGALPAALAANWLAGAWDQNSFAPVSSPIAAKLEEIALGWLVDVLQLPPGTDGAFVTGATMANFAGLLAARHALLARAGWDVEVDGLFGAPEIRVVVGAEAHASLFKALGMAGFGRERVERVAVDEQGRMRPEALPQLDDRTLLCIQAGNVNSGAFDPAVELCSAARAAGAWVHVDGAFGLWAAAAGEYAHLTAGYDLADSWALDAHKWLNVPYDSGLVFVRQPEHLAGAFTTRAAYLVRTEERQAYDYTPENSRRARAVEAWAALLSLGQAGLAELIHKNCRQAAQMADGLRAAGFDILNEVVLNQVVVAFGDDERTRRVITALQEEGTFWAGGTTWRGRAALRLSFSSWATRDDDVAQSLAAIRRATESTG